MKTSRREILRAASWASLGMGAAVSTPAARGSAGASVAGMKFEAKETVRIGFIGVGGRGNSLIDNFSPIPEVRITALCDVIQRKTEAAQSRLVKNGKQSPELYHSSERAFEKMVTRDDIDLIVIATPWIWHVQMAVAGMKAGKHVAVEVPAARTIDDCWLLVNTSEKTRRHCIQLENCCYGETELMALSMVRAGLFGELTHAACAYNHDLRGILFSTEGEGLWRRLENEQRNGNIYPTHGLGPVAHYMDINRGDRFEYMVSMSSFSAALQA
jgi:predicted dehydrogenase